MTPLETWEAGVLGTGLPERWSKPYARPMHSQLLKHNNPRPQRIQSRLVMGRCRESAYWQGQDIPEPFRYSSAEDSNSQPEVNARAGNLASTPATLYLLAHPASQARGMGQEALLHVLSSGLWPQP